MIPLWFTLLNYSYIRKSKPNTEHVCFYLDTDAKEMLTRNAIQLLNAVCVIIQAIETATLTLSDEAREQLDLPKWVKLATRTQELQAVDSD